MMTYKQKQEKRKTSYGGDSWYPQVPSLIPNGKPVCDETAPKSDKDCGNTLKGNERSNLTLFHFIYTRKKLW